jgi:hypothetical protein
MKRRVPILISIIAVAGLMSITVFWHSLLAQSSGTVFWHSLLARPSGSLHLQSFFAAIRKFGISLIVVL